MGPTPTLKFSATQDTINAFKASGTRCYCTTGQVNWETGENDGYYCKNCQAHEAYNDLVHISERIEDEWAFPSDMSPVIEADYRNWLQDDHYPLHEDDDSEELFEKFCEQWQAFWKEATAKKEVAA